MSEIVLNAEARGNKHREAKRARKQGFVPGIFYAHGEENVNINVPAVDLMPLIRTSETHVIDLHLKDGGAKKCILRDVQFDPVSDLPVHFDLQGLRENEKLMVEIPVVLTGGVPKGVRDGGMVQHSIHKLKVSCLPKDIPNKIEINIADMEINHSVHVRDLNLPDVTILENLEAVIVGVMPPSVTKEAEVAATPEEGIKEPEVVGKGKKAEEGEEAAPGGKAEEKPAGKEEKKK